MRGRYIWAAVCLCSLLMSGRLYGAEIKKDWQEEYTDTDTRKGTLAVRAGTFEGFGGEVLFALETEGGARLPYRMGEGQAYILNLSLTPGLYKLCELRAEHDGRKYRCDSAQKEFQIEDGQVTACQVEVFPDSRMVFPEETGASQKPASIEPGKGQEAEGKREEAKRAKRSAEIPLPAVIGAAGFGLFSRTLWKSRKGRGIGGG